MATKTKRRRTATKGKAKAKAAAGPSPINGKAWATITEQAAVLNKLTDIKAIAMVDVLSGAACSVTQLTTALGEEEPFVRTMVTDLTAAGYVTGKPAKVSLTKKFANGWAAMRKFLPSPI